ncbi:MAG: ABC transporter substrate-binding protein [Magnetococcus sp. DMHC-8]
MRRDSFHHRLLGGMLGLIWLLWLPALAAQPVDPSPDPQARYRAYPYGREAGIIDIGIQPLWLPGGIMAEAMRRDGLLKEALRQRGMTIRFHAFLKGADINVYLHDGLLEGGFGGDLPAISACVADQARVVSLATLHFTAIVARKPLMLSDLRGHRIGYAPGSNAHHALLTALAAHGISPTAVTLLPMEVNAMPRALADHQIDAFSAWEPTPTIAVRLYGHTVVHRFLSSGYFYLARSFADRHADLVELLVAAELRALHWLTHSDDHLARAIDWSAQAIRHLTGQDFELSREETLRLTRRNLRQLAALPLIPSEDLTEKGRIGRASRFLGSLGRLPADLPWATVRACFQREVGERLLAAPEANRLHTFAYEEQPE